MDGPIYKLFLNRYTEAWYQLSQEEKDNFTLKMGDIFEKTGTKGVIMCESGWASEEWDFWGVAEYPTIDSVQKLRKLQDEMDWFQYVEAVSVLGTKWED